MKLNLVCTCGAYPEQYDVFDENKNQVAYYRLRHGYFRVEVPYSGGETIYEAYPKGYGLFQENEKDFFLEEAENAVFKYYGTKEKE